MNEDRIPNYCPQCGEEIEDGINSSRIRWNGFKWEHKSREAHAQAGHHVMFPENNEFNLRAKIGKMAGSTAGVFLDQIVRLQAIDADCHENTNGFPRTHWTTVDTEEEGTLYAKLTIQREEFEDRPEDGGCPNAPEN